MLKYVRRPWLEQSQSLGKTVDSLQYGLIKLGVELVLPRPLRLRLRGDEPEVFPQPKTQSEWQSEQKLAEKMAACKDWDFLSRIA